MPRTRRSILYSAGSFLAVASAAVFFATGLINAGPATLSVAARAEPALAAAVGPPIPVADTEPVPSLAELAAQDPMALARLGMQRCERELREYSCLLIKRERLGGKLSADQEIEVRYRENPRTVYMIWKRNAKDTRRALFIDTPEHVDSKGRKVARVEPAGAIVRLFVKDLYMPVRGKRARMASRRFIDEFGFKSTFKLLERYNRLGQENGVLDLGYAGQSEIDGRPTYVIVRCLPYNGPDGIYPDAKMVLHLDQEWLLPVAVFSYADREGRELLGSYLFTDVNLNPGFSDEDFKF